MKLRIKEKEYALKMRFEVRNEDGSVRYLYVRDKRKLRLLNASNEEVAYTQPEKWNGTNWTAVYIAGTKVAAIRKDVKLFANGKLLPETYILAGLDLEIEGNVGAWEHDILRNGQIVARVARESFTVSPSWALDIADPSDELPILMVVLTVDCIGEAHRNDTV